MKTSERPLRIFFSGIAGSGVSAIATFMADKGNVIVGSDRVFDKDILHPLKKVFQFRGITIVPQDGSGLNDTFDFAVFSTAVESDQPEILKAGALGIPIKKRPDYLAEITASFHTIAVAGTSGKSTTAGLLAFLMSRLGLNPNFISGGRVKQFKSSSNPGNCLTGDSDYLIIEACESDGTIVNYKPQHSIILNLSLDHNPIEKTAGKFKIFMENTSDKIILNADDRNLSRKYPSPLPRHESIPTSPAGGEGLSMSPSTKGNGMCVYLSQRAEGLSIFPSASVENPYKSPPLMGGVGEGDLITFSIHNPSQYKAEAITYKSLSTEFSLHGTRFSLSLPGQHNLYNALSCIAFLSEIGIKLNDIVEILSEFQGIDRRFDIHLNDGKRLVIDDYAHNPHKIVSLMKTVQKLSERVCYIFQPHGFGPTRLMKKEYIEAFTKNLCDSDHLILLPIYFAGGTASRDISSYDLAEGIKAGGKSVEVVEKREDILKRLHEYQTYVIFGARDETLSDFANEMAERLSRISQN
ncbi:MAG: hypothetical protein FJ241_07235 [Nitrospira sp.]|nr:hypothetical protein [Nitrospira sp.]